MKNSRSAITSSGSVPLPGQPRIDGSPGTGMPRTSIERNSSIEELPMVGRVRHYRVASPVPSSRALEVSYFCQSDSEAEFLINQINFLTLL